MRKQSFDRVKRTLCILLAVLLLVSLTAASASAWYNKKGEIIAPPEKPKVETTKETKVANVPAPVIAPAPSPVGCAGGFGGCGEFGGCCGFGDCDRFGCCGRCGNEKKIAVITAVRVAFAKGEGCFDRDWW
jgi:hypothetical protein